MTACTAVMTDPQDWAENSSSTSVIEDRNELLIEYLPFVQFVAKRLAQRLPAHVELDDLVSFGVLGLIDAIERFDESRKIKFKTYAEFRIRGAILDKLRELDWLPRSIRQKARKLEEAQASVECEKGGPAAECDVVEYLGVTFDEYHRMVREANGTALLSIDELCQDREGNEVGELLNFLRDPRESSPAEPLDFDQVYKLVAEAIDELPEQDRLVISLYYYDELNMREIGAILDLTESRVSQIHTQALLSLRSMLMSVIHD